MILNPLIPDGTRESRFLTKFEVNTQSTDLSFQHCRDLQVPVEF